jgi:pimeloyl-ACP methyl ester carboxylesterase
MQDIYVNDTGKGLPFVMVHGFLGSSEMWKLQTEHFQKNFRVLTPALPGFGESKEIKSCDSIECMAKAILKSLKIKKIDSFNLLGHSMGGMIAQEMARLEANKILKLIFYGTGPNGNIPGRFETIDESRNKLRINGLEVTANQIAKTWFVDEDKSKYFYLCEIAGKQTTIEAVDNGLIAMKNWNGISNLKNIKNKTLIIWGDQDKAYNYKQVEALKKNISDSALKIFKGCSHNVHLEKPDEFNDIIDKFLKKI